MYATFYCPRCPLGIGNALQLYHVMIPPVGDEIVVGTAVTISEGLMLDGDYGPVAILSSHCNGGFAALSVFIFKQDDRAAACRLSTVGDGEPCGTALHALDVASEFVEHNLLTAFVADGESLVGKLPCRRIDDAVLVIVAA